MTDTEQLRVVLRAQAGDRDSIETLLRALQQPLRPYISGLVGLTSADDVLQEALFQIWRDLRWLREPELLRPWSYRIASRCSFKWLKRNRRSLQADHDTFSVEEIPTPNRDELQLFTTTDEFLEMLSPASRAVLVLHYLHERSLEEVAAILEISAGTAKSRLAYGLSRLREFINKKGVKQ
jgi:RNA polymerase sigma-70 factor (ECF subfamily)